MFILKSRNNIRSSVVKIAEERLEKRWQSLSKDTFVNLGERSQVKTALDAIKTHPNNEGGSKSKGTRSGTKRPRK